MARPLRLEFPGAVYHLTARGNAGQDIYDDDIDRRRFVELLGREVTQQRWRCYAYCLMGNHYHLLIETPEANLVAGMRRLNGAYTQAFNHRHTRTGHLFQGRYKSILVEADSYLLVLCRYLVLNPVRAGMARRPEDWPWSSYLATAGNIAAPAWLDTGAVLELFAADPAGAVPAYRRFVGDGMAAAAPWDNLRGQVFLGGDDFLQRMQGRIGGVRSSEVPEAQRRPGRPTRDAVLQAVAEAYAVPRVELETRRHRDAYRAAAYLLRRSANLPLQTVAECFGVSASRVSHIQRAVEGGKLDPVLLRLLADFDVAAPASDPEARVTH